MKLFGRHKKEVLTYDHETLVPVIRKSICTGEESAGFKNIKNGTFREVMLIRNRDDLREFMELYGIEETPETIY